MFLFFLFCVGLSSGLVFAPSPEPPQFTSYYSSVMLLSMQGTSPINVSAASNLTDVFVGLIIKDNVIIIKMEK